MQSFLNYHLLARRFIIVPLVIILVIGSCVYLTGDLLISMQKELSAAKNINQVLAKSIANKNAALLSEQVEVTLADNPQYESIMYYQLTNHQVIPPTVIKKSALLFEPYIGINEPVFATLNSHTHQSRNDDNMADNHAVGYLSLTLNLHQLRAQWLKQSLPLIVGVLLIWLFTLSMLLLRLRALTNRLPYLEKLSRNALNDTVVIDDIYQSPTAQSSAWLFEQALVHLINRQKTLRHQLEQLTEEKRGLQANNSQQIRHYSGFQNTLSHEFKASIRRIESGLQLLKNQYVSNEQEDAVNLIDQGTQDLNAKLNQIIQLNRIEKGQAAVQLHQFNPSRLIEDIVEQHQQAAHEKSLKLSTKTYHADYMLEGDVQKISTILHSLLENAIRFTERGNVEVISQLQHLEKQIRWTLQVNDTGIGIAEQALKHVFEPFFQANSDTKHSQNTQTVGLFLVHKLVDILGGRIEIDSFINHGTKVTLTLNLHDWKNQQERNLLKDNSITFWGNSPLLDSLYQRVIDTGATVKKLDDRELLVDYLMTHRVDILLISPTITFSEVFSFIQRLRDTEEHHRLLVVYYHTPQLSKQQMEELSIEGVDYFEKVETPHSHTDEWVQRVMQYLN